MRDLTRSTTKPGPLRQLHGVLDGAARPDGDLTLSRPQRGVLPTIEFWNQRGPEFRHVRRGFLLLIVVLGIAGASLSSPMVSGAVMMVGVWLGFLGLGLFERKIRRELEARRATGAALSAPGEGKELG